MLVLFFQYGDYREAYHGFQNGRSETYRDQKASVNFVADLANTYSIVTVAICDEEYDEQLAPELRAIGITRATAYNSRTLKALLERLKPQLIICRTPHLPTMTWAANRGIPTLPLFADIFTLGSLRQIVNILRLRGALLYGNFPCVANHSLNASRSVVRTLLWPERKTVPWDWSRLHTNPEPKTLTDGPRTALFCGMLSEAKGVGDCLKALSLLGGTEATLKIVGGGDIEHWRSVADNLGVGDRVEFLGLVAHGQVQRLMREAAVVVVPSRHDYAEGLPNTIYEALAARTPLIVSDHPAFVGRLENGKEALVFKAADPHALAACIRTLLADANLYNELSQRSAQAHESLYIGPEFSKLVQHFLEDPKNQKGWVQRHSLSALKA
jgi:glycosyltransferase involved in cell wall biosynthesis